MNNFENPQSNPHAIDLRALDGGKYIFPSKACGTDIHNLPIENTTLPVSFSQHPEGYFRLNGVLEEIKAGLVISGFLYNTEAKINHITVDQQLKEYIKEQTKQRVSDMALAELEKQLQNNGIKTVYAVFYAPRTIDFFIRNGYTISTIDLLSENTKINLGMNPTGFDKTILDQGLFENMKQTNPEGTRHVLLVKHLELV